MLRLELDLEVERAAEAAGAVGQAVGHAGKEARLGELRTELALKEGRGAEVEAQARYLVTTPTMAQRWRRRCCCHPSSLHPLHPPHYSPITRAAHYDCPSLLPLNTAP